MAPSSRHRLIALSQAYIRIIEGVDVLLGRRPAWTERLLLRFVRSLYAHRLRGLVAELPGDVTDDILRASEGVREAAVTVGVN